MSDDFLHLPEHVTIPAVKPDGRSPAFDGVDADTLRSAVANRLGMVPIPVRSVHFRALSKPTWRLVVPAHDDPHGQGGTRILEALEPLIRHRNDVVLEPLRFQHPPAGGLSEEDIQNWRNKGNNTSQIARTDYFLLAGGPEDLPFELQHHLAIDHPVGRLSFADLDGYHQYAQKVVALETQPTVPARTSLLAVATSVDDATRLSRRVIGSIADEVSASRGGSRHATGRRGGTTVRRLLGSDATRDRLIDEVRATGSGDAMVLLAGTHGVESKEPAHPRQGAPTDQEGNPIDSSWLRSTCGNQTQPGGGVVILHACNSGGTPRDRGWADLLPGWQVALPEADRVSDLPSWLLAQPSGPLAIVAHVDILFVWGLLDYFGRKPHSAGSSGVEPLFSMTAGLCNGLPVGPAARSFVSAANRCADRLARRTFNRRGTSGTVSDRTIFDWFQWHDARGWIVLGDPMVTAGGVPAGRRVMAAQPSRAVFRGLPFGNRSR